MIQTLRKEIIKIHFLSHFLIQSFCFVLKKRSYLTPTNTRDPPVNNNSGGGWNSQTSGGTKKKITFWKKRKRKGNHWPNTKVRQLNDTPKTTGTTSRKKKLDGVGVSEARGLATHWPTLVASFFFAWVPPTRRLLPSMPAGCIYRQFSRTIN